jgi:hypothetical protein
MFTPEVLLTIGGVVAVVVQGVKAAGWPRNHALWATGIASVLAVLFYTWSKGSFSREGAWDLLIAMAGVYTAAVAAYETVKTTATGVSNMGGPDLNTSRSFLILVALTSVLGLSACGKRYVPGTTPQQAIAYELNEGLKPLVDTQAAVIAAVDAVCLPRDQPRDPAQCAALKPNADKFLNSVYQLLTFVRDEVSPRLTQLDAAMKAVDAVRQGQLRAELVPLIEKASQLAASAFKVTIPDKLVSASTAAIATFTQLRDAVMNVIRSVREDVTGAVPTPTTSN